jgi:hypothetical protein
MIEKLPATLFMICLMPGLVLSQDAASVARAEIEFALDAQKTNATAAFLRAFASDALLLRPIPVNAHQSLAERPFSAELSLIWTPSITESSGDLGISSGPSTFGSRGKPPESGGHFLSVWRRSTAGWQVVIDGGVAGLPPQAIEIGRRVEVRMGEAPDSGVIDPNQSREELTRAEHTLATKYVERLADYAATDIRVFRNGMEPSSSIDGAVSMVAADKAVKWSPQGVVVASSGKLGYVYGVAAGPDTTGYLRVWRKERGAWKLAYDLR